MKDVWEGTLTNKKEKQFGKHPTQKPLYILERIIKASTNEDAIVLDPFCGSSTTGVACKILGRKYIGIDNNADYIELSKARLKSYGEETI
jgi:site-specific DNA-methyltransferase (adenine-specific)